MNCLSRREAADYLTKVRGVKTSATTLEKLAVIGGGPKYRLVANRAQYEPPHLDEYADAKVGPLKSSTSTDTA